jgi:lipopolysaccharide/colanic/teichoic acid biosynthesis glycosyltransferase
MDIAGSLLLVLLTAPLLAIIAAAIRLDSRGPAFFCQERVGRDGRRFQIWKFRTMIEDAERHREGLIDRNEAGGGLFKIRDDPRVTRVGRLLRRTSLDELPQLLNVIRGEMSLGRAAPAHPRRGPADRGLAPPPAAAHAGMTGMWQILARRASRCRRWSRSTTCTS